MIKRLKDNYKGNIYYFIILGDEHMDLEKFVMIE